jgi:hypothetical protein
MVTPKSLVQVVGCVEITEFDGANGGGYFQNRDTRVNHHSDHYLDEVTTDMASWFIIDSFVFYGSLCGVI